MSYNVYADGRADAGRGIWICCPQFSPRRSGRFCNPACVSGAGCST
ncbi:MAG: hypothetical protein U1F87_10090 [Kiritimatiellia bacterium]